MKHAYFTMAVVCATLATGHSFANDTDNQINDKIIVTAKAPVKTAAGTTDRYQAFSADTGTKTRTDIKSIPQSIQVIPSKILEDQNIMSSSDALENVSNVQSHDRADSFNSGIALRGYNFSAIQFDGLPMFDNGSDSDSLVNVERIEVLKGPSSLLYSGGAGGGFGAPIGGTINYVYKKPEDKAFFKSDFTVGSYAFYHPTFDINQPLSSDGTVLFRLTGEYENSNSFMNDFERERRALYPTLTLTNKEDTSLTLQAQYNERNQSEFTGLPATGTIAGDFRVNQNTFVGNKDDDANNGKTRSFSTTFDHKFNKTWATQLKARYTSTDFEQNALFAFGQAPAFGTDFALASGRLARDFNEYTINPNVTADFNITNDIKNTMLIGADYTSINDNQVSKFDFPFTTFDFTNPTFPAFSEPLGTWQNELREFDLQTMAAYVQNQATFYDDFHALAGVRFSKAKQDATVLNVNTNGVTPIHSDDNNVTYRTGLAYDINDSASVFAGYGTGFRMLPSFFGEPPRELEKSKQIETGLKLDFDNGLSGTMSVFELTRQNVLATDPNNALKQIQVGEQRSRGFEADFVWQPYFVEGLSVLTSYGFTDAEVTKDTSNSVGKKLASIPEHSGKFWVNYDLQNQSLRGFSVGAGVYAATGQYLNLDNVYQTAGYYRADAKVAYNINDNYNIALNVRNITDQKYYEAYEYLFGEVKTGEPLSAFLTVSSAF